MNLVGLGKLVNKVLYTNIGSCLKNCNGNGECYNGKCKCNEFHTGLSCEERRCKNDCNNRGECSNNYKCNCQIGYGGEDCGIELCPNNCSVIVI